MPIQTLNNNIAAKVFRDILNNNFTALDTEKAIKNHASSDNLFGAASTNNFGHVKINTNNGLSITSGVLDINLATTSKAGAVQLVNNATTDDATKAATAAALRQVSINSLKAYAGNDNPVNSLGKNGDLYIKKKV